jgi:hypothetical protein
MATQPPDRLSDNAKKTNQAPETGNPQAPLPHHVVMTSVANEQPTPMPYTCIRTLVARQLALPAWFFSPPPAAC